MNLSDLMDRTLLLDLETTRSGKIRQVGAVLNRHIFEGTEKGGSKAVLEQLDELALLNCFTGELQVLGLGALPASTRDVRDARMGMPVITEPSSKISWLKSKAKFRVK